MGGGENPEKTTWHTHKQNLVCVTCDCKTDQLDSNLRRSVHCLGDGCCQSDIVFVLFFFFKKKKKKKKKKKNYQAGSVIKPHCCLTSRKQC